MKENEIRMSVILPIYNVEKYLRQCLESVVRQSLKEIEIICVNDGSTDHCVDIINEFAAQDDRVKVINKENGGLGAARNTGLDAASGEYIWFVDSDDLIASEACEKIYTLGHDNNSDVILMDVGLFWSKVDPILDFLDTKKYKLMAKEGNFRIEDAPWILQTHSVWSRVYRREFLLSNGIRNPEQRFGEDMLYSYMVAVYAERMIILPEKLYYYRQNRKGSLLEQEGKNDEYKMLYLNSMEDTKRFLLDMDYYDILKDEFLKSRVRWALPRQNGIKSLKKYISFFNKLSGILDNEDYMVLDDDDYLHDYDGLREYIYALKKNRVWSYLICNKIKNLVRIEYLHFFVRIPKTKVTIRIPRFHYFARQEGMYNRQEVAWLRYQISEINENQKKLLKLYELKRMEQGMERVEDNE